MKESYIKLPNITTSKLQDVVDYLDENNIEYIEEYKRDDEIERLNNDIKVLLKENSNKEKVIKTQDNIINELEKWLDKKEKLTFNSWNKGIHEVQRKLQELKGVDKE